MSRIGVKPITVPAGVEVTITAENLVTVKGPKGTLSKQFDGALTIKQEENTITVEAPNQTELIVKGIDKQLVGNYAAKIRDWRKPEPYKGKGIRYAGEVVRRKEGKTGKK